jgi:hypothetical protein
MLLSLAGFGTIPSRCDFMVENFKAQRPESVKYSLEMSSSSNEVRTKVDPEVSNDFRGRANISTGSLVLRY